MGGGELGADGQSGAAAERGQEHQEERRLPAHEPGPPAAGRQPGLHPTEVGTAGHGHTEEAPQGMAPHRVDTERCQ